MEILDDTGLMYFKARFYDPAVGRFITADPTIPNPEKSQLFNRYMFVAGSPIQLMDTSGFEPENGGGGETGGGGGYGGGVSDSSSSSGKSGGSVISSGCAAISGAMSSAGRAIGSAVNSVSNSRFAKNVSAVINSGGAGAGIGAVIGGAIGAATGGGVVAGAVIGAKWGAAIGGGLSATCLAASPNVEGKPLNRYENDSKKYIDNVLKNPNGYDIQAYEREVFLSFMPKTFLTKHSYYTVENIETGRTTTLGYSGFWEGEWKINQSTDINSYNNVWAGSGYFKSKLIGWSTTNITPTNGINVTSTLSKVKTQIDDRSDSYSLFDHVVDNENNYNCNTALQSTLVPRKED